MSKPLSGQVAELEATVERQKKQIVWLDTERERLATENAELRKESDALWEVAKHVTIPSEHIRIKDAPLGDYSAPAKDVDTSTPSLKENAENFTRRYSAELAAAWQAGYNACHEDYQRKTGPLLTPNPHGRGDDE